MLTRIGVYEESGALSEYKDACIYLLYTSACIYASSGCSAISGSAVDGACSTLKMFNILIIQLPAKGGGMQRENSREGKGHVQTQAK